MLFSIVITFQLYLYHVDCKLHKCSTFEHDIIQDQLPVISSIHHSQLDATFKTFNTLMIKWIYKDDPDFVHKNNLSSKKRPDGATQEAVLILSNITM